MALFAQDLFDTELGAKPPISAHPAFPAIVALWFAALLGIGGLILPDVLIERLVAASGIGALVQAANPPLGWTARGILAVLFAGSGALAGLAIARRVARAHAANAAWDDDRFTVTRQGPISVRDEVGGDGVINGRGLPVTNRRALAIADEADDDFADAAPLPDANREHSARERIAAVAERDDWHRDIEPAASAPDREIDKERHAESADQPGIAELAQRLGDSLRERRAWLAQAKALSQAASGRTPPAELDVAAPEDAARAMAAYFGGAEQTAPPRASSDADSALRDALATIRRVNGTA